MNLDTALSFYAYGTSEGVSKAWDTRGRGKRSQMANALLVYKNTGGWLSSEGQFVPPQGGHGTTARRSKLIPKNTAYLAEQTVAMSRGHVRVTGDEPSADNPSVHFEAEDYLKSRHNIAQALAGNPPPPGYGVSVEFHKPRQIEKRFDSPDDAVGWLNI